MLFGDLQQGSEGGATGIDDTAAGGFAAFLLGTPTQTGVGLNVVSPSNYTTQLSGYIADTFQVTHNLTFDIGLRYDLFSPLTPRNASGNFIYDLPSNMLLPINQGFVNDRGNVRATACSRSWSGAVIRRYYFADKWDSPR